MPTEEQQPHSILVDLGDGFSEHEKALLIWLKGSWKTRKEITDCCLQNRWLGFSDAKSEDANRKVFGQFRKRAEELDRGVWEADTRSKEHRYRVNPSCLFIDEAQAISAILLHSLQAKVLPPPFIPFLSSLVENATALIKHSTQMTGLKRYARLGEVIEFHPEGYGSRLLRQSRLGSTFNENYSQLLKAALEKKQVEYSYSMRYSASDGVYKSNFSPLGLVLRSTMVYLVAKDEGKGDQKIRHYPLTRISGTVKVLAIPNSAQPNFSLKKYVGSGAFELDEGQLYQPETIRLYAHKDVIFLLEERMDWEKSKLKVLGKVDEYDWQRVEFNECVYCEFVWWLLGFGDQVIVESPAHLVARMRETIQNMHDNYAEYYDK